MKIIKAGELDFACEVLKSGDLLAFPTETVYGLGGNAYSDEVVSKIFKYKNRSPFNPVSVCYSSFYDASRDVEINPKAELLANEFLPGALTIVLKKKVDSKISWMCSAGGDTVGIRVPNNPLALDLLKKLDFPLAAPSANTSSELSTTTAQSVCESLKNCSDLVILDGGTCNLGIESTIIDLSVESQPKILRKGVISQEEIEDRCGFALVEIECSKFSHYKPTKPIVMNVQKIEKEDALLAFGNPISEAKYCLNLSSNSDLTEAAKNFFLMLRKLDSTDAKRICVMPIPNVGIGLAINDRLKKASQNDK